jgi:hypothetical protein
LGSVADFSWSTWEGTMRSDDGAGHFVPRTVGALAAIVVGSWLAVGGALGWANIEILPGTEGDDLHWVVHGVGALVSVLLLLLLLLLAVSAVYAEQRSKAGRLGQVAYAVVAVSLVVSVFTGLGVVASYFLAGADSQVFDLFHGAEAIPYVAFLLGMLLFAIATIRSRTFPTAAAVLLLLGSIGGPITSLLAGIAWVWLGLTLWTRASAAPSPRVAQ